jgi:hypothetical protein
MYAYATDGAHDLVAPVHRDLVNQEKLDVDSMGYPKLPMAMLGGESVILNLLTISIFSVPLTTTLIFLQLAWFWLILLRRHLATCLVKVSRANSVNTVVALASFIGDCYIVVPWAISPLF